MEDFLPKFDPREGRDEDIWEPNSPTTKLQKPGKCKKHVTTKAIVTDHRGKRSMFVKCLLCGTIET